MTMLLGRRRGIAWSAIVLTGLLGASVAVSWLAFGWSAAFRGPLRVLEDAWPAIYSAEAVLAALLGYTAARRWLISIGRRGLALAIVVAWVGQWLVLLIAGTAIANELVPEVACFFWLMGTGGPLQPIAALVGAWIGASGRFAGQARSASARSNRPS